MWQTKQQLNRIFRMHYTGLRHVLYAVPIILPLSISVILSLSASHSTSALTSQNNTNIEFTLNPTLSLSLSGSLSLLGLQPGTSADSNVITINIGTNNVTGYTLSANVGNNDYAHGGTNYNANDLVFTNGALIPSPTTTNKFTSLSTTDSYPTLDNESIADNTWGYSYTVNTGAWSNYTGLPAYNDTEVATLNETNVASEDTIKLKVGAKSASNQVAGTYTNVVNFMAVTNAVPMSISDAFAAAGAEQVNGYYTMQDMTSSICEAVQVYDEDSQTQLIDVRDHKVYWVAKLRDNHCWMTQNLDLDLDSTVALTSEDTDLNEYGSNNYDTANGYACSNVGSTNGCSSDHDIISWLPAQSTYDSSENDFSVWENTYVLPQSFDVGTWFMSSGGKYPSCNFPNTACNNVSQNPFPIIAEHGAIGNFYNYTASIASNDSSVFSDDTASDPTIRNPKNSICPDNWRLPYVASEGYNEFARLNYIYNNGNSGDGGGDHAYSLGLLESPLFFIKAGAIWNSQANIYQFGGTGFYWSSTVQNNELARGLLFGDSYVWPGVQSNNSRSYAWTIRCVTR